MRNPILVDTNVENGAYSFSEALGLTDEEYKNIMLALHEVLDLEYSLDEDGEYSTGLKEGGSWEPVMEKLGDRPWCVATSIKIGNELFPNDAEGRERAIGTVMSTCHNFGMRISELLTPQPSFADFMAQMAGLGNQGEEDII